MFMSQYKRIMTIIDTEIAAASSQINIQIEDGRNSLVEKRVSTDENTFMMFVRNNRLRALAQYISVKAKLITHILSDMITQTKIKEISDFSALNAYASKLDAQKKMAQDEVKRLKEAKVLDDYIKFIRYEDNLIKNLRSKYRIHKKRSFYVGIIIVICCVAVDYFMLFNLFLLGNLSRGSSITSAIIFAVALDAPPYLLGWIIAKKNDAEKLNEIKNENENAIEREKSRYKVASIILISVIILFFIAYFIVRVFAFLGDGNFDLAFRSIVSGSYVFLDGHFNAADLLSMLVPIATSVVAFVIGLFIFSSYVEYLKDAIIAINQSLDNMISAKEDEITECIKLHKDQECAIKTLKYEIWSFYMGSTVLEKDDGIFISNIVKAHRKLNLSVYLDVYKSCSQLILKEAMAMIRKINHDYALFAREQRPIMEMEISDLENLELSKFWKESLDEDRDENNSIDFEIEAQHTDTQNDIVKIREKIAEIEDILSGLNAGNI